MFRIVVTIADRCLELLGSNSLIRRYKVAVGKPSTPTPLGHFTITQKALWGEQFGGYFMQLSIPWGIYGIHGTNKPWPSVRPSVTVLSACIAGMPRYYTIP